MAKMLCGIKEMKKILVLIKKDVFLMDMYAYFTLIVLIGIPLFMCGSLKTMAYPLYTLFLSLDYAAFFAFSQLYTMESKFKGQTYIMACPFLRRQIIEARFVLLMIICVIGTVFYKLAELINPAHLFDGISRLSLYDALIAVSLIVILYDVLFLFLNNVPYEKVRVAHIIISIFVPIWGVVLVVKLIQYFGINIELRSPTMIAAVITVIVTIILTAVSVTKNINIWKKKEF